LTITSCIDPEDIADGAHIECKVAEINQEYLKEDLPLLLEDLPEMIKDTLSEKKETNIPVRFSAKEKIVVEDLAKQN
jgi:hypothetical protein